MGSIFSTDCLEGFELFSVGGSPHAVREEKGAEEGSVGGGE